MNDEEDRTQKLTRKVGEVLIKSVKIGNKNQKLLRILALPIIFDLVLSVFLGYVVVSQHDIQKIGQRNQIEACQRDNVFRKAYVDQWTPILSQSVPQLPPNASEIQRKAYEASVETRHLFEKSLNSDFKRHPCP